MIETLGEWPKVIVIIAMFIVTLIGLLAYIKLIKWTFSSLLSWMGGKFDD